MSALSARFFRWLQQAPVYRRGHQQAVQLLGDGAGRCWLDVGCGAGLIAHLAAEQGFMAIGLDRDPNMIRYAAVPHSSARFFCGDVRDVPASVRGDVVSAASLLFVVPEPLLVLEQLWGAVAEGGVLLIIETSAQMTVSGASTVLQQQRADGKATTWADHVALRLWGTVRSGRCLADSLFQSFAEKNKLDAQRTEALGGLLSVWQFRKK